MRRKPKSKHSRIKTKLGLPDLEHAKVAVIVSFAVVRIAAQLSALDRRVRGVVLLRSAIIVQQNGGHPISIAP